jgi:hypothetical protein
MLRCARCGTVSLFRAGAAELCSRYELEMDSSSIPGLIEQFSVPRESQSSSLLPKGIVATPFFTNPTLVASPTSDLQERRQKPLTSANGLVGATLTETGSKMG